MHLCKVFLLNYKSEESFEDCFWVYSYLNLRSATFQHCSVLVVDSSLMLELTIFHEIECKQELSMVLSQT